MYNEQKDNPCYGDFIELVKNDFITIKQQMNDDEIIKVDKKEYKKYVKKVVKEAAYTYLISLPNNHKKIKHIIYNEIKAQNYLKSHMKNENKELLVLVRSQMVRNIKMNFRTFYDNLFCPLCNDKPDSQEHCLECPIICEDMSDVRKHVKYEHAFGDVKQQAEFIEYYSKILETRNDFILKKSLPGRINSVP